MRRARTALFLPAVVLALSGCLTQPGDANDNGPQEQPVRPTDVQRLPQVVESAPPTIDQPEGMNPTPTGS